MIPPRAEEPGRLRDDSLQGREAFTLPTLSIPPFHKRVQADGTLGAVGARFELLSSSQNVNVRQNSRKPRVPSEA